VQPVTVPSRAQPEVQRHAAAASVPAHKQRGERVRHACASLLPGSAVAVSGCSSSNERAFIDEPASEFEHKQDEEMQAATQSTLLELLANPALHPSSVKRFLTAFPVPESMPVRKRLLLAKQCWEHLLDNRDTGCMALVYGKMELLRRTKLYCPTDLFRQHCHLEQVQLLVDAMGSQVDVGTFLAHLRCSLSVDGQHSFRHESSKVQQLQSKLETADLLMVVHTLGTGNMFAIDTDQLQQLRLVHLARHGPVAELESMVRQQSQQEGRSAAAAQPQAVCDMLDSLHHGFPLLFQPLIECHSGWVDRLGVLLRAGADAAVVYEPWTCSAMHMLFYRNSAGSSSRKVSEAAQVQALQLLLQHGAKAVLNLTDRGASTAAPTQRTALLQAASAGSFQACRMLLVAGADAEVVDSSGQSMLDYLFYLKHSNWSVHRRATAGFTCMELYGLVNEFRLCALVSDELEQDCRSCGRCRFLLASCASRHEEDAADSCADSDGTSSCKGSLLGSSSEEEADEALHDNVVETAPAASAAAASVYMRDVIIID